MITWKLSSYNHDHTIEVQTHNKPVIQFTEIEVYTPPGYSTSWIAGPHQWLPLEIIDEDIDRVTEFFKTHPTAMWMEAQQVNDTEPNHYFTARVILMADGKRLHVGEATMKQKDQDATTI